MSLRGLKYIDSCIFYLWRYLCLLPTCDRVHCDTQTGAERGFKMSTMCKLKKYLKYNEVFKDLAEAN